MITLEDILIVTRTIFGEASSEPYAGKVAVAHVIINRTTRRTNDADHTLAATALRHRQFSAWNEDDPNRDRLLHVTPNDPVFRKCLRATLEAIDEPDPTQGSRHYMTTARRAKGWPRSWGPPQEPVIQIGNHLFYNSVP